MNDTNNEENHIGIDSREESDGNSFSITNNINTVKIVRQVIDNMGRSFFSANKDKTTYTSVMTTYLKVINLLNSNTVFA